MNTTLLSPVDHLEVTILADNYTDMLMIQDTPVCRRPKFLPPQTLLAEHGFSCILKVRTGSDEQTVLMDGGVNPICILHNAALLNIGLNSIGAIVLSHGHPDHFLGFPGIIEERSTKIPFMVHPDAFLERRLNNPATGPLPLPRLEKDLLITGGIVPVISRHSDVLADGQILMTGEIERIIPFEKGFPGAEAKIDGKWVVDPFRDDQGLVILVKGKGLVIISGCAHAGIINTIEYAKKITGIDKIHAVLGGFHLTGPMFEPIIQPTIDEMKRINPDYVIPMHCTGWNTITRFINEMPDKCILNTVGTTYTF